MILGYAPFLNQLLEPKRLGGHHLLRLVVAQLDRVVPSAKWVMQTGLV